MNKQSFILGCFGSSLIFKSDEATCKSFNSGEACAVSSLRIKEALRMNTGGITKALSPFESKVEKTVNALRKLGLNISQKVKSGVNPFTEDNATLHLFCHILIEINKLGRKFTENWVENIMEKRIGAERSKSVKILCAAFLELGVITNENGFLRADM